MTEKKDPADLLKRGQPTKYESHYADLAFWMAQAGLTDKQMADEFNVTEQTVNNWKTAHPEFFESLKRGKETPDDEVEAALLRKARGFAYTEAGKQRTSLPDTVACIFWLKNRRPALWRDKHEVAAVVDLSVRGDPVDIDPADIATIERVRRLQLGDDN